MSEWFLIEYARIRRMEIDEEVRRNRLAASVRRSEERPAGFWRAWLAAVGGVFVTWGTFLQARYGARRVRAGCCRP